MGKYSDDSIRSLVEKSKRFQSNCIYCRNLADTREHIPSQIFIDEPIPSEYPIVPACKKCNGGFSQAETYTSCFIDKLRNQLSKDDMPLRYKTSATLNHDKKLLSTLNSDIFWQDNKLNVSFNNEYITTVLIKLAKGHIAHQLDKVFEEDVQVECEYGFTPDFSVDELAHFNQIPVVEETGEAGSNFTHNLLVLTNCKTNEDFSISPWIVFQDGNYRYVTYLKDYYYIVKIVICETLFAIIKFPQ